MGLNFMLDCTEDTTGYRQLPRGVRASTTSAKTFTQLALAVGAHIAAIQGRAGDRCSAAMGREHLHALIKVTGVPIPR